MGHIGMRYSLPSREIITDAAETVINAHWFDGVFYIPNCDITSISHISLHKISKSVIM
ncbi:hypothetical protein GCM10011409_34850 [Lentibacillus populi]|uniref:Dihydroxy-acid/6-phosphogluconate dehydratase N-terminal domain-containing protein n=1 Tax=Lentibacillus populi TaxID=1827502 RepID=A0A9W5U0R0_9BACI|nr:hypothetical protein GCM10011409_34850 [Lentibacillus populi]